VPAVPDDDRSHMDLFQKYEVNLRYHKS